MYRSKLSTGLIIQITHVLIVGRNNELTEVIIAIYRKFGKWCMQKNLEHL